jgi:hypothetical protein
MPVLGTTAHTSAGPRPPLADRLTPVQWQALDAVAAVLVALWVVFDLRLRHGFRFELPQACSTWTSRSAWRSTRWR